MAQLLTCGLLVVSLLSYCMGNRYYQEKMRLGLFEILQIKLVKYSSFLFILCS